MTNTPGKDKINVTTICAACGAEIHFVATAAGRLMPTNPDGTSHFTTCTDPGRFRKRGRKNEEQKS